MLNQFGEKRDHLVLIVDDTPSTLIVMREILQAEGFRVEEAADGVIAMEAFHRCQPDVVLLDIEMPRKNGFEVCTEIRASDSGHRTPVIMTTGTNDVSAVQRAYDTGASDFISKPINWAVLAYKLRYVLRASDAIAKQHKAALMISGLAGVIENSSNEIYILEKENLTFQDVNLSARVNLGYDADEFYGLTIYDLISGISPVEFVEYLEPLWNGTSKQVDLELEIKRKNGSYYHAYLHLYAFAHEENLSLVIIGQDISERKEADKHMRYLAYFDNLTSLPNRRQFTEELEVMLEVANRRSQQLALLFIDMDNFKRINDTLGHSIGDLLLCEVGVRLVESVRASDRKSPDRSRVADISVSRLGGDEFTVVISHINHRDEVIVVAQRILARLGRPMSLNGHELIVTPSIGISLAPTHGDSVELLLKHADTAMYHAKKAGCNNFQFYDPSMDRLSLERLSMENELYKAIKLDQFELHYQPIIDLKSGVVNEVEALVRWHHPSRGFIMPDDFIYLAEELGAVVQIGEIVLRKACRQLREWQLANIKVQRIAVNISNTQIREINFSELIAEILRETELPPESLVLELTESVLLADVEQNIEVLQKLKKIGISIAVDHFGSGYSSLSYLKHFPIDILKIDRSFINDIDDGQHNIGVLTAVAVLARSFHLKTVAEGIETIEQLRCLCDLNIDAGQGFLISKALPPDELIKGLKSGTFHYDAMHTTD